MSKGVTDSSVLRKQATFLVRWERRVQFPFFPLEVPHDAGPVLLQFVNGPLTSGTPHSSGVAAVLGKLQRHAVFVAHDSPTHSSHT